MRGFLGYIFVLVLILAHKSFAEYDSTSYEQNREVYYFPASDALGRSDLVFRTDGGVNTNPSNYAQNTTLVSGISYANFFTAFSVSSLSFTTAIDSISGLGVSLSYLYIPDIEITTGLDTTANNGVIYDPAKLDTAHASDIMFHVAYGRKILDRERIAVSVGVALNAMRRSLLSGRTDNVTGYGMGIDGGVLSEFKKPGISVGLFAQNLIANVIKWDKDYKDYEFAHLLLGIGWEKPISYIKGHLRLMYTSPNLLSDGDEITSASLANTDDSLDRPLSLALFEDPEFLLYGNWGAEICFAGIVTARIGFLQGSNFTLGAGVALFSKRIHIDFANITHQLGNTPRVSLTYHWPQ